MTAKQEPATIRQCLTCPWKVETVPERDIPNGYSVSLHESLRKTIRSGLASLRSCGISMACHYSDPGEEFACAGWLHNQLGPGNNLGVRIAVMTGRMPVPTVDGNQHERFEDTLPFQSTQPQIAIAKHKTSSRQGVDATQAARLKRSAKQRRKP